MEITTSTKHLPKQSIYLFICNIELTIIHVQTFGSLNGIYCTIDNVWQTNVHVQANIQIINLAQFPGSKKQSRKFRMLLFMCDALCD